MKKRTNNKVIFYKNSLKNVCINPCVVVYSFRNYEPDRRKDCCPHSGIALFVDDRRETNKEVF